MTLGAPSSCSGKFRVLRSRQCQNVYKCTIPFPPVTSPERHCTSSRQGKVMLACWISEELRQELDRVWAEQGLRPHGRTQKGMEQMIRQCLAHHAEAT